MNKLTKEILKDCNECSVFRFGKAETSFNYGLNDAIKLIVRYEEAAKYCQDKRVLDAGCRNGSGSYILSRATKRVYACDQKEEIDFAKKHIKENNIIFQKVDLNKIMPYESSFFDVIVTCEVIEHLKNYRGFISECHRVLKPNGVLFITTPNAGFFHGIKVDCGSPKTANSKKGHYHIHEFWVDELTKLLSPLFKVEKIYAQYIPRKINKMRWPEYLNQFLKTDFIARRVYRLRDENKVEPNSFITQIQIARKK